MKIQFIQVATNLVVGAIGAWIAGMLGVRHGLKRAQREQAFDRRLDWYEQTLRAFNDFKLKLNNFVSAPLEPETRKRMITEFAESVQHARNCVNVAPVYAERKTLVEMRKLFVELGKATHLAKGPSITTQDLLAKRDAIVEIANGIECELAISIRGQLGLDKISKEDFRWEESS